MTAVPAIAPISSLGSLTPTSATSATGGVDATSGASAGSGSNFATALGNGLDAVTGAQANADSLAVQAATGQLVDPAQYTIAATQASLMTQLAVTVQSKAVSAFNTIMGMQA